MGGDFSTTLVSSFCRFIAVPLVFMTGTASPLVSAAGCENNGGDSWDSIVAHCLKRCYLLSNTFN